MSEQPAITVYALTQVEIDEIAERAARRVVEMQNEQRSAPHNEIPTAEAWKYCGFRCARTFRAAMQSRSVRPIRRGWWRRPALDRAMGGRAAA